MLVTRGEDIEFIESREVSMQCGNRRTGFRELLVVAESTAGNADELEIGFRRGVLSDDRERA